MGQKVSRPGGDRLWRGLAWTGCSCLPFHAASSCCFGVLDWPRAPAGAQLPAVEIEELGNGAVSGWSIPDTAPWNLLYRLVLASIP